MKKLMCLLVMLAISSVAFAGNVITIDMNGWIVPLDTTNWNGGAASTCGFLGNGTKNQAFTYTATDGAAPVLLAPMAGGNPTTAASYAYGISGDGVQIGGTDEGGAWRAVEFWRGAAATTMVGDAGCDEAYGFNTDGSRGLGWSNAAGGVSNGGAEMLTASNTTLKNIVAAFVGYGASSTGLNVCGTASGAQAGKGFIDRNGTTYYEPKVGARTGILYVSDDASIAVGITDQANANTHGTAWFNGDRVQLHSWTGAAYTQSYLPNFPAGKGYGTNNTTNAAELTGMSDDGDRIVGSVKTSLGGWQTFLYDRSDGLMYDMADIIAMYGLNFPAGQDMECIMGISPDGETIVGLMTGPVGHDGFIAHIPEPATIVLLGLGGLALIRKRR